MSDQTTNLCKMQIHVKVIEIGDKITGISTLIMKSLTVFAKPLNHVYGKSMKYLGEYMAKSLGNDRFLRYMYKAKTVDHEI